MQIQRTPKFIAWFKKHGDKEKFYIDHRLERVRKKAFWRL